MEISMLTDLAYPARLAKTDGRFLVSFRDVPEALTDGATLAEARAEAADALTVALAGYVKAGRPMPASSARKAGEELIHAASALTAKVALRQAMAAQNVSAAELARRLGLDEREARRLLDPDHPSKMPRCMSSVSASSCASLPWRPNPVQGSRSECLSVAVARQRRLAPRRVRLAKPRQNEHGLPSRSSRTRWPAFALAGFGAAVFSRFASEGWWTRSESN
jgi:antitoxin HicB